MSAPTLYHIPVCPFCQRVEILLELKGLADAVDFHVVDITEPRPDWLLEKTGGSTMLPVLETEEGRIIKESLVILRYFEQRYDEVPVARTDPGEHAVEHMLAAKEDDFVALGYEFVMNQDRGERETYRDEMFELYAEFDEFLRERSRADDFLFEEFGWAEVVYTPIFQRFWFLEYYENFELPSDERFDRVRRWREACIEHPAAQQVTREEIVKLYYDYAKGAGNGALPAGRERSTFAFEPHWSERPWPPRDKYETAATDAELGLVGSS